jgi:hypothetical protein
VLVRQTANGVWGNRRCIGVDSNHGGLTPPALVLLRGRLPAKTRFLRCTNARSPRSSDRQPAVARSYDRCAVRSECCSATSEHTAKSGGREPAVGVSIALARALPLSHAGPPRVCVRMAGAFALSGSAKGRLLYQRRLCVIFSRCARVQGSHGGLTPPALVLLRERLPAKKRFLRCTNARSPRSGGRQPAVGVGNALARALPESRRRETADAVLTDAGAVAAVNHGRLTLLPAPAFRGPQWLHSRAGLPRGVYASSLLVARTHILGDARLRFATASCFTLLLRCGRLAARKRFLRCTNARPAQERRA